ncbi:hypothetical protein Cylst_5202 [Cylindrospermum stagnale PCC 7417]|uniref:Uncharacterized protein n=1 Tax=Cylindrospermum stagnale PCC 7417 TaxID=56107 RepID=K9X456_9NOST|nr:hypothetical protein [Cylindrospermum stagnale]AFZ27238.1 hypothetical protein Cylst_5202 [Cylindrospermum stagnale PCC 7417]
MTICSKCGSKEVYRKHPSDLVLWCDMCGNSWQDNQTLRPLKQHSFWKSKNPYKGRHHVDVCLCPTDSQKYSFSLRYGNSFPLEWENPDYPEYPRLKGCFNSPDEAIDAGIEEIYSED